MTQGHARAMAEQKVAYCPGCGKSSLDPWPVGDDQPLNPTFDVSCTSCGWSGDISPDLKPERAEKD